MSGVAIPPSVLPRLYGRWLEAIVPSIPEERRATCDTCAMTEAAGAEIGDDAFDPALKCCTYLPELPNFQIGRILGDRDRESAAARAWLLDRIDAGLALSPLGMSRSASEHTLHTQLVTVDTYGRLADARCPFLRATDGTCGIWRFREAVCATFYCKHERGVIGRSFWTAVRLLLLHVERAAALWAALELIPGADACERLSVLEARRHTARPSCDQLSATMRAGLWGPWLGREAELFAETARIVSALQWSDIERLGGVQLTLLVRIVKARHAQLVSTELPATVRRGTRAEIRPGAREGYTHVTTRGVPYDSIDVPVEALRRADRRVDDDAHDDDAHDDDAHDDAPPELIRALLDYGYFVPG